MQAAAALAAEPTTTDAATAGGNGTGAFDTETRHALALADERIEYVARTGMLTVPADEEEGPKGQIFFVSYTRTDPVERQRPVTFVFNGGPGAAAAYLHLGLMGPRRLTFAEDGRVSTPPQLVDNAETWLRFSDLVFVDPVGTGFSRPVGFGKEGKDGGRDERSPFWATGKDIDALGEFIRLYLTRNQRWLSPAVLAGESYGGFRVATLADRLQSQFGISVRGLVMISPALELALLSGDRFRLMPWISRVPSFAAAARRHRKTGEGESGGADPQGAVEQFAIMELLPGLAAGAALGEARRSALLSRLSGYIGLPQDLVARYGGKIPGDLFASRLMEAEGLVLSLYDASVSYPAPHPVTSRYRDPRLARITAAVTAAFNHEARTRLGIEADLPYEVLNRAVSMQWTWEDGGKPGAAERLESAFKSVPGLRGLLAHGAYDLVTPYFASTYIVNQLDLGPELRRRLTLRTYEGGHMFYSHAASRTAFYEDARRLYEAIAADASQP